MRSRGMTGSEHRGHAACKGVHGSESAPEKLQVLGVARVAILQTDGRCCGRKVCWVESTGKEPKATFGPFSAQQVWAAGGPRALAAAAPAAAAAMAAGSQGTSSVQRKARETLQVGMPAQRSHLIPNLICRREAGIGGRRVKAEALPGQACKACQCIATLRTAHKGPCSPGLPAAAWSAAAGQASILARREADCNG